MHTLIPLCEACTLAIKRSFYLADAPAEFLGELSSKRINQVVERYSTLVKSERVDELLTTAEWSELFKLPDPIDPAALPERLSCVQRLAVLEVLESIHRRKGKPQ